MPNTPLSVGAHGNTVARLQNFLRQRGFQLTVFEVKRKFFGPATRQALQQFQQQNRLPVTGVVDQLTASKITSTALSIVVRTSDSLCGRPAPTIPDQVEEPAIADFLRVRLAGIPADGSTKLRDPIPTVVWVDRGDEVLVHLDATATRVVGQTLLVSIDLETDQTGRKTIVVPFALAQANGDAGLIAVTDMLPRGNGVLVSRWGTAVQAAVWNSLLQLAEDHAGERNAAPRGLTIDGGSLRLRTGAALTVA
jgi:hypothetical protein